MHVQENFLFALVSLRNYIIFGLHVYIDLYTRHKHTKYANICEWTAETMEWGADLTWWEKIHKITMVMDEIGLFSTLMIDILRDYTRPLGENKNQWLDVLCPALNIWK